MFTWHALSCLLYGCVTPAMRAALEPKKEMRMIRWMRGVSLKERQPSTERLGVEAIWDVMRRGKRRWHGHVENKYDAVCVKIYMH